ncbi:MAG: DUF262 domain-containing protein [Candidatus Brocadiia bacterium]
MPLQLEVGLKQVDVQSLIQQIEDGEIVLPDFQRDFVWPTHQVGKLLESILNGYYINTLLSLPVVTGETTESPFPPRQVDGAPTQGVDPFSMQMILDGQQRISSIYYAVTAPEIPLANTKYAQLFCLDWEKVLAGDLDEDAISWRRWNWKSSQRLIDNDLAFQIKKGLIPFTIFKSKDIFKDWRRGMEALAESRADLSKDDVDLFEDNTEVFRSYKIPVIQLNADTPEDKVVQTFERINTQGLELGVFDILTARLWTRDIRLRDLWEDIIDDEDYPRLATCSDMIGETRLRELMLKTLALHRGGECKDRNLRQLAPESFAEDWENTAGMMDRMLEKAVSPQAGGLGVSRKFGFPYTALIPTLANMIHHAETNGSFPDGEALKKVYKWYWISVFSARYSGSSDTKLYQDMKQLTSWLNGGDPPNSISEGLNRIPVELDLKSVYRGGKYRAVMSLLLLAGARDFGTLESISLHKADDHHIFPASQLKKGINGKKYEDRTARDNVLNRTVIEAKVNRFKYRDQLPGEYVPQMIEEHTDGKQGVKRLLKEHLINEAGFKAMLENDYEAFLSARKAAIQQEIEDRVGESFDWSEGNGL